MAAGQAGLGFRGRVAPVSPDPGEDSPCRSPCSPGAQQALSMLAGGTGGWVSGGRRRGRPASLMPAPRARSVPFPGGLDRHQVLRQQVRALGRGRHRPDAAGVLLQRRALQRGRGARPGRPSRPGPRPPARGPPEPPVLEPPCTPPRAPPTHPHPAHPHPKCPRRSLPTFTRRPVFFLGSGLPPGWGGPPPASLQLSP